MNREEFESAMQSRPDRLASLPDASSYVGRFFIDSRYFGPSTVVNLEEDVELCSLRIRKVVVCFGEYLHGINVFYHRSNAQLVMPTTLQERLFDSPDHGVNEIVEFEIPFNDQIVEVRAF
jgi:hypothetical protein